MRLLVLAVALLAGLKVWTQDRVYRTTVGATVISAYRDRAADACHGVLGKTKAAANPWASAASADVVVGDPNADVAIWEVDNPMWEVRFRHPHLVLTTAGREPRICAFDLAIGMASVRPR